MELKKYQSYVAYFDLLGFKGLVNKDPKTACERLEKMKYILNDKDKAFIKPLKTGESIYVGDYLKYFFFSDSVIFYTLNNSERDLLAIILGAGTIATQCIDKILPLRGGITQGDLFVDTKSNIYCGIPLVRAYQLAQSAQWIGIIVDEPVALQYSSCSCLDYNENGVEAIIEWNVPMRGGGLERRWVFNWGSILRPLRYVSGGQDLYGEHYQSIFGKKFTDLAPEIQKKYNNTANFFNFIVNKYKNSSLTSI